MPISDSGANLEQTVKTLLRTRGLSMRQLAKETGIPTATISKMVRGKQRINPNYLQRLAQGLGVAPWVLFTAAGFSSVEPANFAESARWTQWVGSATLAQDMIAKLMDHLGIAAKCLTAEEIAKALCTYEDYARTPEGKALIEEKFPVKRQQVVGIGPFVEDLDEMYTHFCQPGTLEQERAILGSGLLYFVLATDSIPDYLFPLGYLDDALAVVMTHQRLRSLNVAIDNQPD
ncbi:helix-turn-helix domain-containing protein [Alicyclobacillaceae bacterium I2511]|jgi:transcriptional regulator with XRE-family HTH domain/uncharacterized membrane protein YkvA (DUF1232 family)|nr:helix-turn-helix domain-containing protein [Alicyclobacillaceae bacterium I2511]